MTHHHIVTRTLLLLLAAFAISPLSVRAQWMTQTHLLKPGWNAVYLHIDATHELIDEVVTGGANPISEIWLWQPESTTAQFVNSPQEPSSPNSQWAVWNRSPVVADSLLRLSGNAAYLVLNTNSSDFVWQLKGRPVAPNYEWTTTGLNFIGFATPTGSAPNFDEFLTPAPTLHNSAEIYQYVGGELSSTNPARVFPPLYRNTEVTRGRAYWMRGGGSYNRYFGPIDVTVGRGDGLDFGENLGVFRVRVRNNTSSARTIAFEMVASETAPAGQAAIEDLPPMLVRGPFNSTNLTFEFTRLNEAPQNMTLAAQGEEGSELDIVFGLDRSAMTASAGSLYAGILKLTDTNGLQEVNLPVSATVGDTSGLWVGQANITQVGQYLKTYQRDADGDLITDTITTNGAPYVATGTNTAMANVARPYPLRLILHNNGASNSVTLLQRVFYGPSISNGDVVATSQSALDAAKLASARRVSSAHFPFSHANTSWPQISGQVGLGSTVNFSVAMDYNDHAANPFLHTYHPDHDNLKTDFETVDVTGAESYNVSRAIRFSFTTPGSDFSSLTTTSDSLVGTYTETITFSGRAGSTREFNLAGNFALQRISPIATLTTD